LHFLRKVDFEDIADHPTPAVRFMEGHYSSDGSRHAVWLDKESPDFEGILMHQTMRAILMERGFPRAECVPAPASCSLIRYLGDGRLLHGGFPVYNREMLISRATADAWLDALQEAASPEFLFCKWTLFTVVLRLDPTFKGDGVERLHALIRGKFSHSAEFGDRFSTYYHRDGI
jgi:hypothetical protein